MKFYMHCESPEMTLVLQWEENNGTIKDILQIFKDALIKQHPSIDYKLAEFCVKNSKRKVLHPSNTVESVIKHMDDIFVAVESDVRKEDISQLTHDVENVSISKVGGGEGAVQATEPIASTSTASLNTGSLDESLQHQNQAALLYFGNQRYRKTIIVYKEILKSDPKCKIALKGLATCYLRADRPKDALRYVKKGLTHYKDDIDFLFLEGEVYVDCKDGEGAIETLMRCAKVARNSGGISKEEKQDLQVLLAKAYLLEDQKDMAIAVLQGVLRENLDHKEALVEYAELLFPLGPGQSEEAITVILTILGRVQGDARSKEVFASLVTQPTGIATLKHVAKGVMEDTAALVYLASCLRDKSAIKEALDLLRIALKCDPSNPCTALFYIHTLELTEDHVEIIKFVKDYLSEFPDKRVGHLACSTVLKYMTEIPHDLEQTTPIQVCNEEVEIAPICNDFTEDERYLLAFHFTVVKVLYMKGLLQYLPPLLGLLEPLCQGKQLDETDIRNEAAYFNCINDVLKMSPDVPFIQMTPESNESSLYFVGDSHCLSPAWQNIKIQDTDLRIRPILSTGTKLWHLRPESSFYTKTNFYTAIRSIPDGSMVAVCLGEIDCREALLQCWEKAKYDRIEDGMQVIVDIYVKVLKSLHAKHGWQIYIHPILPVLYITRPVVMQFNRILASRLRSESSLHWLNFVDSLLSDDGEHLRPEFQFDGTHVHPRYTSLLADAIANVDD